MANRPGYAYNAAAYYAAPAPAAVGASAATAATIPAATSVPSYAAGYETTPGYSNQYYYDTTGSYNYIQYPTQPAAHAVVQPATVAATSHWSAATTAATSAATTAAYTTPTTVDPWKPVSVDYSQNNYNRRGRGHQHSNASSRGASSNNQRNITNQPAGFGGGYTGAPGAPSTLSSALLASAASGGENRGYNQSSGGRGGRGGPRGGGRGGARGGMGGAMNRPPKPVVQFCTNIDQFFKDGLRGQHPTGWVQEKARKHGWHVDGKEGSGEKGYTYDLIIAELSAKGLAKKKKDAKSNAFRIMSVKLAIKTGLMPSQGDEEELQKKIDAAIAIDHQVVVVAKPKEEPKKEEVKKADNKSNNSGNSTTSAPVVTPAPTGPVTLASPVTLPAEATEIPKEIPKFTDDELALFPGKAVTLLIEALRTYGNLQPIFTSVNEERVAKQPGGGRMLPKTEFTCKAKYIIHGTVYCYFGRAFNKKSAKEQASAFAYLGLMNKTFKSFAGQDAKDPMLKDKAAPCIVYQQQQAITVVGSDQHAYQAAKINLPAGGKKEVPVASVAPTPQQTYQQQQQQQQQAAPKQDNRQQLKRPAGGHHPGAYGVGQKFRKY